MALLELIEVTMKFGELVANDRVSFTVEAGSIVGFIGPNGAGKTTLFSCISGLYKPSSGRICFDGEDITGLTPYQIARKGAVRTFQVVRPLKEMTVFDNVLVGAFLKCHDNKTAFEKAAECIRLCELRRIQDKLAGGLPIAGKRRLEMARALAAGPKLLMLDEMSLCLMPSMVEKMMETVIGINKAGTTVLLVEQMVQETLEIAHRGYVIQSGNIVQSGTGRDLLDSPDVRKAYLGM